jgi:hypothetical protein
MDADAGWMGRRLPVVSARKTGILLRVVLRVGSGDTSEVRRCAGIVVDDDQLGSNDSECLPYRDTLVTPYVVKGIGCECRLAEMVHYIVWILCIVWYTFGDILFSIAFRLLPQGSHHQLPRRSANARNNHGKQGG